MTSHRNLPPQAPMTRAERMTYRRVAGQAALVLALIFIAAVLGQVFGGRP